MKALTRDLDDLTPSKPRAQRIFTDREEPRHAFDVLYEKAVKEREAENCYVLSYYGRGGIGKTSLLKVLTDSAMENGAYVASYDMRFGREPRRILSMLRNSLVQAYPKDFNFDVFDLALLQYSSLTGIHNESVERENRTIIDSNPYISAALAGISHFQGINIISTVIESLNSGYHFIKDIQDYRRQEILKKATQIVKMTASELQDTLPVYFSRDLAVSCKKLKKPLVIFLDTYELLVNYMSDIGMPAQEDRWLRNDIIHFIPNSLWVIAGRDRLRWKELEQTWREDSDFEDHLLGHLGKADSLYFLETAGITDSALRNRLYDLTDGDPLLLDLSVTIWESLLSEGRIPVINDFDMHEKIVERYLRDMDSSHKSMAELLACLQSWNDGFVREHSQELLAGLSLRDYETLCKSTLVHDDGNGHYHMHEVVSRALLSSLTAGQASVYMNRIAKASENRPYSIDFSAELEIDTSRLIESLKKRLAPSCTSLSEGIHTLEHQGNYKEVGRILEPLYNYEESIGFADTDLPVYSLLRSYLYALSYTNHTPDFLSKTQKLYLEYQTRCIPDSIRESVNMLLMDAYNSTRNYNLLQKHAESILAGLGKAGRKDNYYNSALIKLAAAYEGKHMYEECIPLLEDILSRKESELKTDNVKGAALTDLLLHLAEAYRSTGYYKKARSVDERAYRICLDARGEKHPDTLQFMNNLALDLTDLKQYPEAEELLTRVIDICKSHDLETSGNYFAALDTLGLLYSRKKEYQKALENDLKVYKLKKDLYGPGHPNHADVYISLHNLSTVYYYIGEKDKARRLDEEALAGLRDTLDPYDPDSLKTLYALTYSYDHEGEYATGEAFCREVLEIFYRNPAMSLVNAPYADQTIEWLTYYCRRQKDYKGEESSAREWVRLLEDYLPQRHARKMRAWYYLFSALYRQKAYVSALEVSTEALRYASEHEETSPEKCSSTKELQEWSEKCREQIAKCTESSEESRST